MPNLTPISTWSPVAKLFVFIVTTLMLAVCGWAVFIYTVEKGEVDQDNLPAYLTEQDAATSSKAPAAIADDDDGESRLRHNLGLAHTHVNGQTLLFFVLGAVFLFTSVKKRTKKIILWTFGLSIVFHAVGLTGEGFHWFFDDILAVSGVVMLVVIAYICLVIYVDLGHKRETPNG
jgi:hypothetical protein